MLQAVLVFVGGGLGAVTRHGVNLLSAQLVGTDLPWATFIINVTGSVAMGLLTGWFAFHSKGAWSQEMRLLATTGFLGGYTTFSTFSLDASLLWERHDFLIAAAYVMGSVLLGILGLFLGLWLMRATA